MSNDDIVKRAYAVLAIADRYSVVSRDRLPRDPVDAAARLWNFAMACHRRGLRDDATLAILEASEAGEDRGSKRNSRNTRRIGGAAPRSDERGHLLRGHRLQLRSGAGVPRLRLGQRPTGRSAELVAGSVAMAIVVQLADDQLAALAEKVAALIAARTPPEWMSADRAAAYLGVTRKAVYHYMERSGLPYHQDDHGGKLWFKRSELDGWRSR